MPSEGILCRRALLRGIEKVKCALALNIAVLCRVPRNTWKRLFEWAIFWFALKKVAIHSQQDNAYEHLDTTYFWRAVTGTTLVVLIPKPLASISMPSGVLSDEPKC